MEHSLFNDRLVNEDRHLSVHSAVKVCWTDSGYSYQGTGRIASLNSLEASVTLTTINGPSDHGGRYHVGSRVSVPRYHDQTRWSDNSSVRPL